MHLNLLSFLYMLKIIATHNFFLQPYVKKCLLKHTKEVDHDEEIGKF